jgi:hypothetical protein
VRARRNPRSLPGDDHYTDALWKVRRILGTGLRPGKTGVAYATKSFYPTRRLATAKLATETLRTWGILFSVPRGIARYKGEVEGAHGQPGGGQEWVFDGGVTRAQGFRPVIAFALLPF